MNGPPGTGVLLDGRYRVGPMIARGGMSTVHRGTDTRLDRPVAIKIMDPRLAADPVFRTRFEREAHSAARIDHPAVVGVHDRGADRDGPGGEPVVFLVMELVDGGTLRDVLRARGAIGVPAALAVMEPVLAGLAQAHRLDLVHRDVKPENVLISRSGEVKVADFGLVTAAANAGASHVGVIMGTVAYLSPEQVTTGAADPRSDVYAAGILLYELLTGAPPYTGDTSIAVAFQHVKSDVPAPSLIAGDVPPELDAVVRRATAREPAARYADAAALLAALREVRHQLAVPRVAPPLPPVAANEAGVARRSKGDSARPADRGDPAGHPGRGATSVHPGPGAAAHHPGPGGTASYPSPGGAAGQGPSGTRALPRPDSTGTHDRPDDPGASARGAARRPQQQGSRRMLAAWIAVVVALGLLVTLMSWWLGSGRWTQVPSLVGLQRPAAERLLTDADLLPVVTQSFSDDVAAGVVAAVDPAPQAQVLRGSEVKLTVSNGRPVVPDIAPGTSLAAAEQAIRDAGLTPAQDDTDGSDEVPAGAVLRTNPKAGKVLPVGARVGIVLSSGVGNVRVPILFGRSVDDARRALEDLGLRAKVSSTIPFGGGGGTVVEQSPAPFTKVHSGSTVEIRTLF